jgi:hypothetical protein
MTLNTKDGVYPNISDVEYHGITDSLSSTGARKLLPPSTPEKFKHWRDHPQPPSDAFDIGHVVHALVLGKGAQFTVLNPSVHGLTRKGELTDAYASTSMWKDAVAAVRAAGQVPIHIDNHRAAVEMADAVHAQVPDAFTDGEPEVTVFATDPRTGVKLRARFDWLKPGEVVDLKTAASAEPRDFERAAGKFGYYVQEAFYRYVAQLAGLTIERFRFVVVEKADPYPVTEHEYDDVALGVASGLVRQAIDTYAQCAARDEWPGYEPGVHLMSLPPWLLDDEMVLT